MKKHIFIIVMAVICLGICSFGGSRSIGGAVTAFTADNQYKTDNPDAPAVYMTTEITPEALVKIYERLGFNAESSAAVKMSTGESTPQPQANMTYADGALTISNLVGDAKLIHASYTNGTLSGLEITDAKNSTTNVETRSGDKFMLWSAIGEMIPISSAITVETGTITEPEPTPTPTPEPEKSKTLVAYFSWTNHTEEIANYITEITDADKYEIIPKEPYGPENNNYYDQSTRAYQEQYDGTARPEIDGTVSNMEQYDIVFVGYPIWYGKAPKIIYTFLEQYDFAGKTVIPFCTSASSGIGSTSELQRLTHDANWLDGKRFNIGESKDSVTAWVNGLGLDFGDNEEVNGMVLINGGTFRMGNAFQAWVSHRN